MDQETLWRQYTTLPTDAQQQVLAFIAFLTTRTPRTRPSRAAPRLPLTDDPFVGMWAARADLIESTDWVQTLRRREWEHRRG